MPNTACAALGTSCNSTSFHLPLRFFANCMWSSHITSAVPGWINSGIVSRNSLPSGLIYHIWMIARLARRRVAIWTAVQSGCPDSIDRPVCHLVKPNAVVGHSSGEITAAYCAGGLVQRVRVQGGLFRGVLASNLSRSKQYSGSMLAASLSENDAKPYLKDPAQGFGPGRLMAGWG